MQETHQELKPLEEELNTLISQLVRGRHRGAMTPAVGSNSWADGLQPPGLTTST